jgi:hypothetical protein
MGNSTNKVNYTRDLIKSYLSGTNIQNINNEELLKVLSSDEFLAQFVFRNRRGRKIMFKLYMNNKYAELIQHISVVAYINKNNILTKRIQKLIFNIFKYSDREIERYISIASCGRKILSKHQLKTLVYCVNNHLEFWGALTTYYYGSGKYTGITTICLKYYKYLSKFVDNQKMLIITILSSLYSYKTMIACKKYSSIEMMIIPLQRDNTDIRWIFNKDLMLLTLPIYTEKCIRLVCRRRSIQFAELAGRKILNIFNISMRIFVKNGPAKISLYFI